MLASLYRFLLKYRRVNLPGIGTVVLQKKSAKSNFVDNCFLPPEFFFDLHPIKESPSRTLFSWLASSLNVSEREAISRFNDFVFYLKSELDQGKKIIWSGVGVIQKAITGEFKLESADKKLPWLEDVVAKRVIRQDAEHTMLVGDVEKSSVEMAQILSSPSIVGGRSNYWWVWPLAVILASILFLGWYFSEQGLSCTSTGNHHKVVAYKIDSGH